MNRVIDGLADNRRLQGGCGMSNDLSDIDVSDDLTYRLQTIAAIGDMLGSVRLDELSDDTVINLGVLLFRAAREANVLAEEMWERMQAARFKIEEA